MTFTAEYFFNAFGSDALDQWDIALAEHGHHPDHQEEERWTLQEMLES